MAEVKSMLMKQKWYPRPHDMRHAWLHGLETGIANDQTIYPIAMYDEGLGAPSTYEAHPEHASFVEAAEPNCFVDSRINSIIVNLRFSLTKAALTTDNLPAVRVGFMPIFMSFIEDYTAIDELSSLEVQDVLEMQTESTDRQGFPLYTNTKIAEKIATTGTLAANVPGLTATQIIEGVNFSTAQYYDMLHFLTNSGKLKACQGGLKWMILTSNRPVISINLRLRSKVKRMNPFTFFGVMINVPGAGNIDQIPIPTDTTNVLHVGVDMRVRFNEWNQGFLMTKV